MHQMNEIVEINSSRPPKSRQIFFSTPLNRVKFRCLSYETAICYRNKDPMISILTDNSWLYIDYLLNIMK